MCIIIAYTVLFGSYIHVGCWLPSSYVQFDLLDISRQLACMKLGSRGKHQPMQYCWVHTSQLLGYLIHTCHLPIDIQLQYLQPIHVAELDAPDPGPYAGY